MIFSIAKNARFVFAWLLAALLVGRAGAQDSSLFRQDIPAVQGQPITLAGSSWVFQKADPPKEIKLHDIITVIVNEKDALVSKGEVQRRRTAQYQAQLQDWIKFKGLNIQASNPSTGQPDINGNLNVQNQAQMELDTNNALSFTIAATVADIRPNGTLVIEARMMVHNNEERWEQSLTGVIRREDVLPNNTVLSQNIAELSIYKRELGHVRDGYKRGWFTNWFDRFSPF
ncbi:MAG TPA: flagellar basal body L-ring protein FlgH [Pirellulales bacterium]|jgi:flagellar L-ring protein precursor FlgH|nr:flagellar basal body L-ring protein FlgH [Pirellulales bacterium]